MLKISYFHKYINNIGGSGGRARCTPPLRVPILSFDIQNFRNVTASGVHTPSYEVHAPLREILDPPLNKHCTGFQYAEPLGKSLSAAQIKDIKFLLKFKDKRCVKKGLRIRVRKDDLLASNVLLRFNSFLHNVCL